MTLIAGIISRKINLSIPPSVKAEMPRLISRNPEDEVADEVLLDLETELAELAEQPPDDKDVQIDGD